MTPHRPHCSKTPREAAFKEAQAKAGECKYRSGANEIKPHTLCRTCGSKGINGFFLTASMGDWH